MVTQTDIQHSATPLAEHEFPGMLAALTPARKGEESPAAFAVKFYSKIDALMGKIDQPLACEAGCSYCCHYHVYIYAAEAFAMVEALQQLPDEVQRTIIQAVRRNLETIKTLTVDEYISTNIPCAFLIDGRCGVYSARPSACRHHHSLDGVSCKITFDDPTSSMQNLLSPEHMVATTAMICAFENAQLAAGTDAERFELHSAVLEAIRNPDARARWRSGKVTFPRTKDRFSREDV